MPGDYYKVLGVDRAAPQEEIKRRYREIARQHHPDKNPNDPISEAIFKDAAEAYRVLSDPDLRTEYDRRDERTNSRAPGEVFEEIFGGMRRQPSRSGSHSTAGATAPGGTPARRGHSTATERGSDLRYMLEISFEDAALGCEKTIVVPQTERCHQCAGTGAQPGSTPVICRECQGTGTETSQRGFFESLSRCARCGGVGKLIPSDCRVCGGRGRVRLDRTIQVRVPAGVDPGTRLKLSGEGEVGHNGGPPGDLFVVVDVKPHPLFDREGVDILVDLPVSMVAAALGGRVHVPTLDGLVWLELPAGVQHGRVFRLRGKGLPVSNGSERGDQRVRVLVELPEALTLAERTLLEQLAHLDGEAARPQRVGAYEQVLRDLFPHMVAKD